MGAGKSSIGVELAKGLGFRFVDLDHGIEKTTGMKIRVLFKKRGEKYFRRLEKKAIVKLGREKFQVVSTGGGAWLDPGNRRILKKAGLCIWLKATPRTTWKRVRLKLSQRPLLGSAGNPHQRFLRLFSQRRKIYSLADLSISTDGLTPREATQKLLKKIAKSKYKINSESVPSDRQKRGE